MRASLAVAGEKRGGSTQHGGYAKRSEGAGVELTQGEGAAYVCVRAHAVTPADPWRLSALAEVDVAHAEEDEQTAVCGVRNERRVEGGAVGEQRATAVPLERERGAHGLGGEGGQGGGRGRPAAGLGRSAVSAMFIRL